VGLLAARYATQASGEARVRAIPGLAGIIVLHSTSPLARPISPPRRRSAARFHYCLGFRFLRFAANSDLFE
jgi:hypothetical protein